LSTDLIYYYDKAAANRAVAWIERYCTHVKGDLAGQPFTLEAWQKEKIIKPLFGWKHRTTKLRRYRRCFVFIPRKNGKSTLGSAIALYLLCADGEKGAEVYSAASDRFQAGIVHEVAKTMVAQNEELSRRLENYMSSIVYNPTASFYKAISSEVKGKHGYNAHGIIFDELHTQPNRDLWDVLTTSIGSRSQPLIIIFTTAGFDRNTICYEQYEYAKKVAAGIIRDDTFLPVIYESEEEDDIHLKATWKKANPNFGIAVKEAYIKTEAKRAVNEPAYENTFRRLQLNQWTTSETKWINDPTWMTCNLTPIKPEEFHGRECYGALDLASTRDITVFFQLFPGDDGTFTAIPHFFIPELTARERTRKDGVNYDAWIKAGLIHETPGNVTDYDYIRAHINEIGKSCIIKKISFDRWNASQLIINLQADGFECEPFGQGYGSMSSPTKELEAIILQKRLNHGGNPVLRWMCSNVMIQQDPAGNIKIDKKKSKEKVDGMVALVMALGSYMNDPKESNEININFI